MVSLLIVSYSASSVGAEARGTDHVMEWESTSAINRVALQGLNTANLEDGSILQIFGLGGS